MTLPPDLPPVPATIEALRDHSVLEKPRRSWGILAVRR